MLFLLRSQRENMKEFMSTKNRWDMGLDDYYLKPRSMALEKWSPPHAAQTTDFLWHICTRDGTTLWTGMQD